MTPKGSRLRIAFLLPSFPELSNTFILSQITGLIDRGHDVDLFAIARRGTDHAQPDVARYDLDERMRHLTVPRGRLQRLGSALRLLTRPELQHRAMWDALDGRRHGRDAWSLVQLHTAASFLRLPPYDVLHCQFGHLGPGAERLVALGAVKAKLVTSFRGADLSRHLASRPRRFAALLRNGDLFLPVSGVFAKRLVAAGAPSERVLVQPSGIDLARFPFVARTAPTGPARLLFVGRLTEKKGVEYAIDAFAMLRATGREAEMTIIGDGPLASELRQRSRQRGVEDRIRFMGKLPQDRVVEAMRDAHVLVAPSVTAADGDQEGIPNVVKEAMAMGMPVISTRHSGIPELIEDGVNGLLAPERDAGALAELMVRLLDRPETWPRLGAAGRRTIEERFDAERLNDLLVQRYRSVLDPSLI